ncbi:MAG TPA: Rieske 2Fe-2S domain-containing protein, partial [Candidatus Limnocylindria bacterium]|nr:Rieske 2Fe-2S domain-containing protein [Candidatus Limnocylindria bacterium]
AVDLFIVVTGESALVRVADFLLVASFISSLASIVSGFTDWNETYGEERRTGMLHGLLQLAATLGFLASLWLRVGGPADARAAAVTISTVAWLVMAVAAYLGGEMVFGYGTEVNRQAHAEAPTSWARLDVPASGLEDRKPVVAKTKKGFDVFVVKLDGQIYAMGNTCTHAGGPLNEGTFVGRDRCEIQCPWHGSRFCVKDGGVHHGPATFDEPAFETRVNESGAVEVRAR